MTCVFITYDGLVDPRMNDALAAKGVQFLHAYATDCELYQGDVYDTVEEVDAWFEALPWQNETATLTVYSHAGMVTTVIVDGEPASTTRANVDTVEVEDWLEDAA